MGGNYGPDSLAMQPWRFLTHVFVHIGIIHLALNMFVLMQIGPLVERIFGARSFAVLYLSSGVSGGLLSVSIHPAQVSAGASGALFGVYGALGVFLWRQRAIVSASDLKRISKTTVGFIIGDLLMGFQLASSNAGRLHTPD